MRASRRGLPARAEKAGSSSASTFVSAGERSFTFAQKVAKKRLRLTKYDVLPISRTLLLRWCVAEWAVWTVWRCSSIARRAWISSIVLSMEGRLIEGLIAHGAE
jgi:hypothetical protein